jgi:ribosomal protein S18 acetylase RimI-like enzyme
VPQVDIRDAQPEDIDALAEIWFDGWQDAHLSILPARLARARTKESFRQRLEEALSSVRVAIGSGPPLGFAMVKGDELYQFYVAREARGRGVAALLMEDSCARLRREDTLTAWLACAIGNLRAAKFYEKAGWRRASIATSLLETPEGTISVDVWRYEIDLNGTD